MTSRAVAAVTAAALAAVVTVSACAPAVGGHAVTGESLRPSSELKSGASPATPAAVQQQWQDVTGQGTVLPRDSVDGAAYSPKPVPGSAIWHTPDTGSTLSVCTAGPTAITEAGAPAVVIAGHCANGPRASTQYTLTAVDGDPVVLGTGVDAVDDDAGIDSALLATPAAAGVPASIAGTWPIAGVLTVEGVEALPAGTPICYTGAMTGGTRCGGLIATNSRGIEFDAAAVDGDSGSPVFVVNAAGDALLVGIVEWTDDVYTSATVLDGALTRLRSRAVVDPAAAARTADHPRLSPRTVTR
ncbi:hypothetical protein H7J08_00890 [Mycobacterium frederiksbergense]|uniref:S1 family peptidase n=1 Tax=Mycolicibacterium frederiksbergense TaxID=117567 RepID=UPI0021F39A45|nr:S1 family peptidase [Mycolicibacterium frederiksbergense]MCV7043233.1 hypothetical protein [Mycolicibacterium frederiksbergense]